jgi:protein-disulfide isomerase
MFAGHSRWRNSLCVALAVFAIGLAGSVASADDPAANVLSRDKVLRDPDIPVLGNPDGDVTIVEYYDYQCPFCKKIAPELAKVVRDDGKVRLILKDWPVFGDLSKYAARIVLASKYQNKFQAAHDALMNATEKLTDANVPEILTKAGIDVSKATTDLASNKDSIDALMARNDEQAQAFGFQGTPSFIVGTFRIPGGINAAQFKQAIADARAAAKKTGTPGN